MDSEKKMEEEKVSREPGDIWEAEEDKLFVAGKELVRPGEFYFLILLFILTLALLIDSFKLEGLINGKLSSPSSVPQVILFSMLVFLLIIGASLIKVKFREKSFREIGSYLISKEVVILLCTVVVYALILPYLHFAAASLIFLWGTMFLLDRRRPLHLLVISAGILGCIILIFHVLMKVVLP